MSGLCTKTIKGVWFAILNEGLEYSEQIKPANFLLIAHTNPLASPGVQPAAQLQLGVRRLRQQLGRRPRVPAQPQHQRLLALHQRVLAPGPLLLQLSRHPR